MARVAGRHKAAETSAREGIDAVGEVLALADLIGRRNAASERLWLSDCARRVATSVFTAEAPGDPGLREALEFLREGMRGGQVLVLHQAWALATATCARVEGRAEIAARVVLDTVIFVREGKPEDLQTHAAAARQAMVNPYTAQPWLTRAEEQNWQARRLLWRLGLMLNAQEIEVRLDLADFNGALPTKRKRRDRFEQLRELQFGDRDARIGLIVEFPELVFGTELGE